MNQINPRKGAYLIIKNGKWLKDGETIDEDEPREDDEDEEEEDEEF